MAVILPDGAHAVEAGSAVVVPDRLSFGRTTRRCQSRKCSLRCPEFEVPATRPRDRLEDFVSRLQLARLDARRPITHASKARPSFLRKTSRTKPRRWRRMQ